MCIIVYKTAGIELPADHILQVCFENNPHGAGFMYRDGNNKIQIRKGFTTAKKLLKSLHREIVSKEIDCAIHFRIATHGKICRANSHPFPITANKADLQKLTMECNRALVHNGILSGYGTLNGDMSDSGFFAKMLYPCNTDEQYKSALNRHNQSSKFVVMTNTATFISGDFIEDNGIRYSNTSYKVYPEPVYYGVKKSEESDLSMWEKYQPESDADYWERNKRALSAMSKQQPLDGFRRYLDGGSYP